MKIPLNVSNPNIVDYVVWRVNNKYDAQMYYIGERGQGKSYAALRTAEVIDPTFNIDRVVFGTKELFRLIKLLENKGGSLKGKVIVYDEAGVGMGNRDWQKENNKLMNYFLQQCRTFQLVIIYTTPNLSFVDKQARVMGGVVVKFSAKLGRGFGMPYGVETDEMSGELRTPRFYVGSHLLGVQPFSMPSKSLADAYEEKAQAQKRTSFDLENLYKGRLTKQQKEIWDLHKQGLLNKDIADMRGVHNSHITRVLQAARKKMEMGY